MTQQPVARGDKRRTALLESLDHYLREGSLDSINIADISRRGAQVVIVGVCEVPPPARQLPPHRGVFPVLPQHRTPFRVIH